MRNKKHLVILVNESDMCIYLSNISIRDNDHALKLMERSTNTFYSVIDLLEYLQKNPTILIDEYMGVAY